MPEPITRAQAQSEGLKRFYTAEPCRNGHVAERYTRGGHCMACQAVTQALWKERLGPDGMRTTQKRYDDRYAELHASRKNDNSVRATRKKAAADPTWRARAAKKWNQENPVKLREVRQRALAKLKATNPLAVKLAQAARRAAYRAKSAGAVSPQGLSAIVRRVWQRSGACCAACAATGRLELDHIAALKNGGTNDETNFQFLCATCNRSKGTLDSRAWLQQRTQMEIAA